MKTKVGDSEYVYPFSNKNLLISDGTASVIDTETLLHSITVTNPLDESEVALSNLIVGNTYNYSLFIFFQFS